jgi:hypothetical protein
MSSTTWYLVEFDDSASEDSEDLAIDQIVEVKISHRYRPIKINVLNLPN